LPANINKKAPSRNEAVLLYGNPVAIASGTEKRQARIGAVLLGVRIVFPHPGRFTAAALMVEKLRFQFSPPFVDRSSGFGESTAFMQQFFDLVQDQQLDLGFIFG
jgi:hypothetical protein